MSTEPLKRPSLEIAYPSRMYSILNMLFMVLAFFFGFAAVFYANRWFAAGPAVNYRDDLRRLLGLTGAVFLEAGITIKLYSVLNYFKLNPMIDGFEEDRHARERLYRRLCAALLVAVPVMLGLSVRHWIGADAAPTLELRMLKFLQSPEALYAEADILTAGALLLFCILFMILRLHLRYQETLEQKLMRASTRGLLDRI